MGINPYDGIGNSSGFVNDHINDSFNVVKAVKEKLPDVTIVAENIDNINTAATIASLGTAEGQVLGVVNGEFIPLANTTAAVASDVALALQALTESTIVKNEVEELVLEADSAKVGAEAAQAGAESAEADAQIAKTDAETAKTQAEAAQTGAQTAQAGAETARDGAENLVQDMADSVQDIADYGHIQVVAAGDSDPLLTGQTIADLVVAESNAYTNARYIRTEGTDIFIRPDLPDGAIDAERYGIGESQTAAENGARLTWLIARGYRKIVHRAALLEASGIEVFDRDDLTISTRNLHNPSTSGEHTFHFNKDALFTGDVARRLRIEADLISNVQGSGDVFRIEGLLGNSPEFLSGCQEIVNSSDDATIFHFDPDATQPGRSTNLNYTGIWRTTENATKPIMFQDAAASNFNANRVAPTQLFCSDSTPAIQLLNRSSTSYNNGNIFELPLEYCIAGGLHLTGFAAPIIKNVEQYDMTHWGSSLLADIIYCGAYAGYIARYPSYAARAYTGTPLSCHGAKVDGYKRDWSITVGSYFDINIASGDEFYIDGVITTSGSGTRTIAVSVPSVSQQGAIGPNCNNISIANGSAAKLLRLDEQHLRTPSLSVNGWPVAAVTVAAGDVSSGGVLSNSAGIASVTKSATGQYDVVLETDLGGTAYQVAITPTQADVSARITKTSGTAFTVYTRSIGSSPAPADKSFGFIVSQGV